MRGAHRKQPSMRTKIALTAIALGLIGLLAGFGTWSAFSSTTSNTGNSFSAGDVILTDNDAGSAMLSLANAKPGDSDTSCIVVTYSGSLPSTVRLYGTTGGSGLDQYLDLTITRGTDPLPSFDSCAGFTPDATDYIGAGAGVIFDGTLQAYPDDYAGGLVDPIPGSPESWTNSEAHGYRFVVSVQDDNSAQGLTATQTFTWEARDS
jgi:predicted ribosomally synthesized peptide with SipW-like signal peptide